MTDTDATRRAHAVLEDQLERQERRRTDAQGNLDRIRRALESRNTELHEQEQEFLEALEVTDALIAALTLALEALDAQDEAVAKLVQTEPGEAAYHGDGLTTTFPVSESDDEDYDPFEKTSDEEPKDKSRTFAEPLHRAPWPFPPQRVDDFEPPITDEEDR